MTQNKTCRECEANFVVSLEQLTFLEKISPIISGRGYSIPAPTLCPSCRLWRRLVWRNEGYVTSHASSFSRRPIFSSYFGKRSFPVVSCEEWWSDSWDSIDAGREYDFNETFFSQWRELRSAVPHPALSVARMENSDYCANAGDLKNCYLLFNADFNQDCMYGAGIYNSRDCIDCADISMCELCYDCTSCQRCYNLQASESCEDCIDSHFLLNCRSSQHCFGCVNLRRRQYCIFNKQVRKEEYARYLASLNLSSFVERSRIAAQFEALAMQQPRPHVLSFRAENCTGNCISQARNCTECYMVRNGEDLHHCFSLSGEVPSKDCWDASYFGGNLELAYECTVSGSNAFQLRFCHDCWDGCSDLSYCDMCPGCEHCFGCVGLRKKSYCILNKQYSREQYEDLLGRVIEHMRGTGEWGEFFPAQLSPCPYNLTVAQFYFPKTREEVERNGMIWVEREVPNAARVISAHDLPDGLPASDDSITAKSLGSGRAFRITGEEIKRYRSFNVPLPRYAYDERIEARRRKLGAVHLFPRRCAKTGRELLTPFGPESPWIIWDREVYEEEFN